MEPHIFEDLTPMKTKKLIGTVALLVAIQAVLGVAAAADDLQTVVVTATRMPQSSFDLPVSITSVGSDVLQGGRQEVNLSESLARVPGLIAQNRQNYAQDLQISIRGFGARSTFGVRGVRLYADGIPATLPDGQGQVSHFDLGSAGKVEILRGPFSSLYGNSSGGVIALFTEDGLPGTRLSATVSDASFDARRYALKATGESGPVNYVADVSRFETDGYRDHSAARRDIANAKVRYAFNAESQLTVVANAQDLTADDPLGLTLAQLNADPHQAGTNAVAFNARKTVKQQQIGLNYSLNFTSADSIAATAYTGHRATVQFQAIPTANQAPATSAGGVIDLNRDYWGSDVHWTHMFALASGKAQLTAGITYDKLDEDRKGYQNYTGTTASPTEIGVLGPLRRSEANSTNSFDQYVQLQWEPTEQWLLLAGVRNSKVKFDSRDLYIVTGNGDDSGSRSYSATTPVAGITWRASDTLSVYTAYGQGFETPTFNELAYRSVSGTQTGLNLDLAAARSRHYELGVKTRLLERFALNADVFRSDTRNELSVLANTGGRAVYQNVDSSRREGVEIEFHGNWPGNFGTTIAYTWLRAEYQNAFRTCTTVPCVLSTVPDGNTIPGIPPTSAYAEISWKHPATGFSAALEGRYVGGIYTDDLNGLRTSSQTIANLSLGLQQETAQWRLEEYLRVDNLADSDYVGSVIVNESNQRYFEPAPGRTWLLGFKASAKL